MDRTSQGLKIIIRNNDGTSSEITMYSDDGKMPSTIEIGGAMKTTNANVSEIEVEEDQPLIEKQNADESNATPKKTEWIGIYSTIQEILTAICALVTSVIMIMTLVKFFSTSHIAGAWPTDPKLYPTYLLLITSLITLIIDVFSLGERYCGKASKKNVDTMISKMRYALLIFQAVGSATGAGVFKGTQAAGSGQDLFGWTCSDAADQMGSVNSSDLICSASNSSSILSILQTCLHGLGILITVVTMMAPKGASSDDAKDKSDEEAATKTQRKSKRASCGSCGNPILGSKPNGKVASPESEESGGDSALGGAKPKPDEPQVDTGVVKPAVKQTQALYTRLQPSNDPQDISHYGEPDLHSTYEDRYDVDKSANQTGYANVNTSSGQVAYDDFDMQNFP